MKEDFQEALGLFIDRMNHRASKFGNYRPSRGASKIAAAQVLERVGGKLRTTSDYILVHESGCHNLALAYVDSEGFVWQPKTLKLSCIATRTSNRLGTVYGPHPLSAEIFFRADRDTPARHLPEISTSVRARPWR